MEQIQFDFKERSYFSSQLLTDEPLAFEILWTSFFHTQLKEISRIKKEFLFILDYEHF